MNRGELAELAEATLQKQQACRLRLLVCCGTPCVAAGAEAVVAALREQLTRLGNPADLELVSTGCQGPCSRGPLLTVLQPDQPEQVWEKVTPELACTILSTALQQQQLPEQNLLPKDWPFFSRQIRLVLANSGRIDPESLEQYIARGGYESLAQALHEMSPDDVCDGVVQSGLRGRGGGGYSTGLKWQLVRKSSGGRKFVVANGDEGDPGAYMDRSLMESDPHRILEGMAIAGYAIGADQGYVYVRGEYPVAAQRLHKAIKDAERAGLLGSRVLDSSFSFRIDIRIGAGAFVCGEETALLASIMGRRGQSRIRPPYPAEAGLWGCPTLINNVETFGNIPSIFNIGPQAFNAIGNGKSRGTKVFALCGEVVNNGLIEVPMGISLREVVFEIGGGLTNGMNFKAAQTGGPSGGCIPAEKLDTPVDYENLQALGSIMGSGGLIVMGEKSCMVDVARFFMEFCLDESCGKCVPCRTGTVEIYRLLSRICNGSASQRDLQTLEQLCQMVKDTSLCGLGAAAPNPVLSTLRWFRQEYEAHINDRRCPAGVCTMNELPLHLLGEQLLQRISALRCDGEEY
ncbi:MAG: NAD(P)H-dependent oxidoreductase subunit E [Trichlorobacter sp.]|uniref:NuoF family protein n=1 Tax=Trichlorobacter sp. TaxID=2911007 RepID=UPI00256E6052|nr:NuoF family protein [Trichlorobacter sp.]MDK9717701.1 NAD(P)H-dependent oxidoreductase subunit E [Trichlorobacter sp.]